MTQLQQKYPGVLFLGVTSVDQRQRCGWVVAWLCMFVLVVFLFGPVSVVCVVLLFVVVERGLIAIASVALVLRR